MNIRLLGLVAIGGMIATAALAPRVVQAQVLPHVSVSTSSAPSPVPHPSVSRSSAPSPVPHPSVKITRRLTPSPVPHPSVSSSRSLGTQSKTEASQMPTSALFPALLGITWFACRSNKFKF